MANSNQVIFLKGKEKALQILFDSNNFGYLAIGYDPDDLGFEDSEDGDIISQGFLELDRTISNYSRIPLDFMSSEKDPDTGKVLVKFSAELKATNINGNKINQMAIVDSLDGTNADTTYFSATTFPTFNKTNNSSITFVIGMRL